MVSKRARLLMLFIAALVGVVMIGVFSVSASVGVFPAGQIVITETGGSNANVQWTGITGIADGADQYQSWQPAGDGSVLDITPTQGQTWFNDTVSVRYGPCNNNKELNVCQGVGEELTFSLDPAVTGNGVYLYRAEIPMVDANNGAVTITAKLGSTVVWSGPAVLGQINVIEPGNIFDSLVLTATSGASRIKNVDRGDYRLVFNTIPADAGRIITNVFNDRNGNGRDDASDEGIPGTVVELLKDGASVATVTTDANGDAVFFAEPGNYQLRYNPPADHAFTVRNASGVAEDKDSDANPNPTNRKTSQFALGPNATITNIDAGLWAPGTVVANVFNDRNGNGRDDASDEGVAGVTVELIDEYNGRAVLATGTTDANGDVTLGPVPANRAVRLRFYMPADHTFTVRNASGVADDKDSDANPSSGYTHLFRANRGSQVFTDVDAGAWAPGTVEANVFNDRNGNGRDDASDEGVAGVTVELIDEYNGRAVLATGTTDANGDVTLGPVPADRAVRLRFYMPADHAFTVRNASGVAEDKDSDANPSSGYTTLFRADRGSQVFTHVDAGAWAPGTVVANVFNDRNGNGRDDASDEGVAGVFVELIDEYNGRAVLATGTTDANGDVTLGPVPADRAVRLRFYLPPDHAFTVRNASGVAEDKDSDANPSSGYTTLFRADRGSQVFTHVDAGAWAPGSVVTNVFNDRNGNGRDDASDEGVADVFVELIDEYNGRAVLDSGYTDGDGNITLNGVPANRAVRLRYHLPPDHAFTVRDNASEDKDSDANPNSGFTHLFSANRGSQVYTSVDAGAWVPGTVETNVFYDTNGNGRDDASDEGVAGVTVELLDETNGRAVLATAVTDANGNATLGPVPADRPVRLRYYAPAGTEFTLRDNASDDKDSDANPNSGFTTTFSASRGSQDFTNIDAGLVFNTNLLSGLNSCGLPVNTAQINRVIQYSLGVFVDCSTTTLYDPNLTDVQRVVVGQRNDGRPGAWEVDNDGLIRNPRFRGSPGNCCNGQPLLHIGQPLPGSSWDITVTGISDDGRVISGNAVYNGTPYSASGGQLVPDVTQVGVYWVLNGSFYGRIDSVGRIQVAGTVTASNTWASNNLLLNISGDSLRNTQDVDFNGTNYVILGRRSDNNNNSTFIVP